MLYNFKDISVNKIDYSSLEIFFELRSKLKTLA